jgi:hypothetical protein
VFPLVRSVLLASLVTLLTSCNPTQATSDAPDLLAAARGTDRPFGGECRLTIQARTHDEDEGGGCGGGDHADDAGGSPPIPRHFDVGGVCELSHLGRTTVSGRLNITGPFGGDGGHADAGTETHGGGLAVRGRLAFVAANGDQLTGSYVPLSATFDRPTSGSGGTLSFSSTLRIGQSCDGHADGESGPPGGESGHDAHEEPVSTGRFSMATGQVTLQGGIVIMGRGDPGRGLLRLTGGRLSY